MPIVKRPQSKRHTGEPFKLAVVLVAVALVLLASLYLLVNRSIPEVGSSRVSAIPKAYPVSISSRALFFGTTYWGRYINEWSQASQLKEAYPFSDLQTLNRKKYDAWIANLECPTVPGLNLTAAEEEETLSFNCSPKYLAQAKKWFTAFGSANNHAGNQGEDGIVSTRSELKKNGIQYFGNPDPEELDDVCEVLSLPTKITTSDGKKDDGYLPVALCAYHGVFQIPSAKSLAVMKQYSNVMPVIAFPHSGAEYKPAPDDIKQNLYRAMIDNGADMVLGDHPHWVQTTEAYKGKLIVYSMGNFMFDQQFSEEVTRGAAIEVLFKTSGNNQDYKNLESWLKLGETCKKYQDDCLKEAKDQNLTKLPLSFGFNFVATDNSNKITKLASPELSARVEQRLGWNSSMAGLKKPYYGL